MKHVHKFALLGHRATAIEGGIRALTVQMQGDVPTAWVERDVNSENVLVIWPVMTGGEPPSDGRYVSTIVGLLGWRVAHFYARGEI